MQRSRTGNHLAGHTSATGRNMILLFQIVDHRYPEFRDMMAAQGSLSLSQDDKTPEQRHQAVTWTQPLKRAFNIDVSICSMCGGEAMVITRIEDQGSSTKY